MSNFEECSERIVAAVKRAAYETVIMIGHCGPTGLGDAAEDPCGRDWHPIGGDYGDPDLEAAIDQSRGLGKTIPLVAFGHMHHHLRHTKERLRKMVSIDAFGTVYLNSASVPRIRQTDAGTLRNFSLVTLESQTVSRASLVWVNQSLEIHSELILHQQQPSAVPRDMSEGASSTGRLSDGWKTVG